MQSDRSVSMFSISSPKNTILSQKAYGLGKIQSGWCTQYPDSPFAPSQKRVLLSSNKDQSIRIFHLGQGRLRNGYGPSNAGLSRDNGLRGSISLSFKQHLSGPFARKEALPLIDILANFHLSIWIEVFPGLCHIIQQFFTVQTSLCSRVPFQLFRDAAIQLQQKIHTEPALGCYWSTFSPNQLAKGIAGIAIKKFKKNRLRILEIPKLFNSGNTSFMISSRSPNIMFCSLCSWVPCAVEWGHSVQTTTPNINPLVLVHTTSPASRESLQPSHSQPMDLQVLPRVDGYLSWQGDASPSLPPSPIHPPVT